MSSLSNFFHPIPHPGYREGPRDCRMLCYRVEARVLGGGVEVRAGAGTAAQILLYSCLCPKLVTQQGISGVRSFGKYQIRQPEAVNLLQIEE